MEGKKPPETPLSPVPPPQPPDLPEGCMRRRFGWPMPGAATPPLPVSALPSPIPPPLPASVSPGVVLGDEELPFVVRPQDLPPVTVPPQPHQPRTVLRYKGAVPHIEITPLAQFKMYCLIDMAGMEVGWLGTVRKLPTSFLIEDVFLIRQEVTGGSTMLTTDGLTAFGQELLSKPDGVDKWNRMQFWGHSHVHMATVPSPQDNLQLRIFRESEHPWFIRGIGNKRGRLEFSMAFFEVDAEIVDIPWTVVPGLVPDGPEVRKTLEAEYRAKVSERIFPPIKPAWRSLREEIGKWIQL